MTWNHFIFFAIVSVLLWATGAIAAWKNKSRIAIVTTVVGLLVFLSFIIVLWMSLERPPLRTMGETRLWYSLFLPFAGMAVFVRWRYKWILSFSTLLATVFICINLLKPEIHNKTLMPALQSAWFAPHVIVYMFAYALLGAAAVMAVYLLFFKKKAITNEELDICDNLVYVGLSFMTLGMLMGALWAKEAWGTLLGMGSERNLGCCNMVFLSCLRPFSPLTSVFSSAGNVPSSCFLYPLTNVLVGHQLFAVGARYQCAHL